MNKVHFQATNVAVVSVEGKVYLGFKSSSTLSTLKKTIRRNQSSGLLIPSGFEFIGAARPISGLTKHARSIFTGVLQETASIRELDINSESLSTFVNQLTKLIELVESNSKVRGFKKALKRAS